MFSSGCKCFFTVLFCISHKHIKNNQIQYQDRNGGRSPGVLREPGLGLRFRGGLGEEEPPRRRDILPAVRGRGPPPRDGAQPPQEDQRQLRIALSPAAFRALPPIQEVGLHRKTHLELVLQLYDFRRPNLTFCLCAFFRYTLSVKRRLSDACGVVTPNVRRPSIRTDLMIMRTKTCSVGHEGNGSSNGSPLHWRRLDHGCRLQ